MSIVFLSAALAASPARPPLSAEKPPEGAKKRSAAVFALGYEGQDLPRESLGEASRAIRKVFADFGRFKVVGMRQRLSPAGADELAEAIAAAKKAGRGSDASRRFDGTTLSSAEFDRVLAASLVAIPSVSKLESFYDEAKGRWETDIAMRVLLVDPASGDSRPELVEVRSSGYDGSDRDSSATEAGEGIPMRLQSELRKRDAFRAGARVLSVSGEELELGTGMDSGVKKGDEYAVLANPSDSTGAEEGCELALLVIERAGAESSTARVLYSRVELDAAARLEEIPRVGVDVEPYLHIIYGREMGLVPAGKGSVGASAVTGLRVLASRGFYGLRPYGAAQVPAGGVRGYGSAFVFPVDLVLGAEYRKVSGRLSIAPCAGLGAGFVYASETIRGGSADSSNARIPHIGGQAYLDLAILASRDVRLFADLGGEYWFSTVDELYTDYGGVGFGAGVSIKL